MQLLNRSAADRLGSGPNEESDIKLHAFYRMIDWQRLVNKEVQPPFKPKIVRSVAVCGCSELLLVCMSLCGIVFALPCCA